MEPLKRPSSVLMSRPFKLALFVGLVTAVAGGCGHRRTAMRPVYVGPATPIIAPSSAPCPITEAPPAFSQPGEIGVRPIPTAPQIPSQPGTPTGEPPLIQSTPGFESGENLPVPNSPTARRFFNRRASNSSRRSAARDDVSMYLESPNELFLPPKADRPWKYIVIHHSDQASGSYAQIDREDRQNLGTNGCGYHLVIGNGTQSPDGRIEVARRWSDQKAGAHCRDATLPDANDYGIGVCLVGDLDQQPPTQAQINATKSLIAYLRDRYSISADHVVLHSSIAQTPTTCPGTLFPAEIVKETRNYASR